MKPKFLVRKIDEAEPYLIENALDEMDSDGYDILSVYGSTFSERQFLQSVKTSTIIVGKLRVPSGRSLSKKKKSV